ncbi:hypothetical protein HOG21_08030 [bacterium]|nr:hypothetical protein [bacterium]
MSSVFIGSQFFSRILTITSRTVQGTKPHSFNAYIHLPINTKSSFLISSLCIVFTFTAFPIISVTLFVTSTKCIGIFSFFNT